VDDTVLDLDQFHVSSVPLQKRTNPVQHFLDLFPHIRTSPRTHFVMLIVYLVKKDYAKGKGLSFLARSVPGVV
jgi:hypothetical protein